MAADYSSPPCGCVLNINCKLHKAAPQMYRALKAILDNCEFLDDDFSLREAVEIKPTKELVGALQSAREALQAAERKG